MKFLSALFHPAPGTPAPPVVVDASDNPDWSEWKLTITPSPTRVGMYTGRMNHPRLYPDEIFNGSRDWVVQQAAEYKNRMNKEFRKEDEDKARLEKQKAQGPEVMYL